LLYALTYFAIALVGMRQSQSYNQSLLLTQKQKRRITSLSQINRLIIDQMQSGVVAYDNEYKIIMINTKAKEIIKLSREQILPNFLIKKIVATAEDSHKSVIIHGEEILIHVINKDKSSGLNLLFLEQQKQINDKSLQMNLANLGQLSATIAHELRNPMAAIYSAAQLLNESKTINTDDKTITDIIIKSVERSNEIIEDVLLMSKPHVAKQTTFNLYEKLIKFKNQFYEQHNFHDDECEIECNDPSITILFDNTHINQIFWNLAENALKHGIGNKFKISVYNLEKYVFIDFINEGAEFESIVEESLFTPFFTTHTQGTGLGLYICREMCRSNNAKLEYLRLDLKHVFRIHIQK
jgi:two-component system sensor histidine kinase PilS (NtrC family)